MRCAICGQRDVDGAIDDFGDYICVDCWATGEAKFRGRKAKTFVPANVPYHVEYSPEMQQRFLDACNQKEES